jgi:hypothetical protein
VRDVISLTPSDYAAVEGFPLAWRWTRGKQWNVLPPQDLSRIRPLVPAKAAEVYARRLEFLDPTHWRLLREDTISEVSRFNDAGSQDDRAGRAWLEAIPVPGDSVVLVSWGEELAARTDWSVFRAYWSDFCYPFDQVVIWPLVEGWVLLHYEERLYFGTTAAEPPAAPDRGGG